jgi:hypothetical protein
VTENSLLHSPFYCYQIPINNPKKSFHEPMFSFL